MCVCVCVCVCVRERETERQTDRQTERGTERERDREREKCYSTRNLWVKILCIILWVLDSGIEVRQLIFFNRFFFVCVNTFVWGNDCSSIFLKGIITKTPETLLYSNLSWRMFSLPGSGTVRKEWFPQVNHTNSLISSLQWGSETCHHQLSFVCQSENWVCF